MIRKLSVGILGLAVLLIAGAASTVFAAAMENYCMVPQYVSAVVPPNVMFSIDVSGSMGWDAYKVRRVGDRRKYCSNNSAHECNDNGDCSRKYCSLDPGRQCSDDNDCQHHGHHHHDHNWGTCTAPVPATGICATATGAMPYGYCSNSPTTACTSNTGCTSPGTCIPRAVYEGYFTPETDYFLNADGIYYEQSGSTCTTSYSYLCKTSSSSGCSATPPAAPNEAYNTCATGRYYCSKGSQLYDYTCNATKPSPCTGSTQVQPENANNLCPAGNWYCTNLRSSSGLPTSVTSGDCGSEVSGNYLNWNNMKRIDVLRWAITGGRPASCSSSDDTPEYCDKRIWAANLSEVGSACSDTQKINTTNTVQGGCVLNGHNGTEVAVPWSRINSALAFEMAGADVVPRMGAVFYEDSSVITNENVYVGDYTSTTDSSSGYPFQNLITNINSTDPGGGTPTGPSLGPSRLIIPKIMLRMAARPRRILIRQLTTNGKIQCIPAKARLIQVVCFRHVRRIL